MNHLHHIDGKVYDHDSMEVLVRYMSQSKCCNCKGDYEETGEHIIFVVTPPTVSWWHASHANNIIPPAICGR
jgi:hypothetical protein